MEKDFYAKSIEFTFQTKKLSTYEIKQLNHPFLSELPKHLYKYRKSGKAGRIDFYVGERKIYTASFNKLNDKFEGVTPATKERILKFDGESMCRYYKDSIISILKERFPSLDVKASNKIFDLILEEHFDKDAIYKRSAMMVKDTERKQLKTIISALSYIFEKMDTELNSNKDFAKGMRLLMNINDEMGAYCMCDSLSNDNLWALYADDFAGYCIEYDLTEPCRSKGSIRFISNLYPVKYVKKKDDDWFKPLFEMTIKTINVDGKASQFNSGVLFNHWMLKVLCSKKDTWSGEKEWRALGKANTSYTGPLISSIIVGHNICKSDFEKISEYAKKKRYPLMITHIDYNNQEVVAREITEEDIKEINLRE